MPDRYYGAEAVRVAARFRARRRARARLAWAGFGLAVAGIAAMAAAVLDAGVVGVLSHLAVSGTWWAGVVAWAAGLVLAASNVDGA